MGIGASIALLAIGAILAFAVDWHVSGVSLHVVGVILMIAGVIGLIAVGVVYGRFRNSRREPPPPDTVVEERRRYYEP